MADDRLKRQGPKPVQLIPPEALPEWRELVGALEVHGPVPCEESATPDDWHADKGPQLTEAQKGCGDCGAVPECLAYAIAADERFGVWGGKSAQERVARSRPAAAA